MLSMFSSATRLSLLIMILVLCGVNIFALVYYPGTTFDTTFKLFSDILIAVTSFFFGKSTGGEAVSGGGKDVEKEKPSIDVNSI